MRASVASIARRLAPAAAVLVLAGCQGNGNFPLELSTTTPVALQQLQAIAGRLDTGLRAAAAKPEAATPLQAARSLLGIPLQFLNTLAAKATTIRRTTGEFTLTYTSDDSFTPQAFWQVTISGGRFGATPQTLIRGNVTADGRTGTYDFSLASLGDTHTAEWLYNPGDVLVFKVTPGAQRATVVTIRPDGHGDVATPTSTASF